MKFPSRKPALSAGLVCALAAILIALAVLQVHWTGQVSQADAERMQTNLHTAVMRFRRDFYLQLLRICWAFQSPTEGFTQTTLKFYADRYDDWMSASARPDMIAALFVWDRKSNQLLQLSPAEGRFKPAAWPPELGKLRHNLEQQPPALAEVSSDVIGQSWALDEESQALFHPFSETNGLQSGAIAPPLAGGLIVELDMRFIWRTLLPELNARYFRGPGGPEYRVSIISGDHPEKTFYESAPAPSSKPDPTGDVAENFIGGTGRDFAARPAVQELAAEKTTTNSKDNVESSVARGPAPQSGRRYLPLISIIDGGAWRLVVRHRSGSVEAAVESLRHRNLTVSFSVLLLLAASMALIVVSAQRAHRLATLQMDFVAGVSHELRTPLAVICSAAENLADGVVGVPEQVKNYGALIRDEGRRLSEMVGQVLVFAAGQANRRVYHQISLDMAEVVESTLASIQPTLDSGQITVEKHLQRGILPVMGDPSALGRCLQNLISNAVKYGGESRWVGVRAETAHAKRGDEVSVIVEDHGLGIDPEDLPHIFEPFYRGKNGGTGHVHGTGLGLSLAKDIAEAMGGRLSVKSAPGKGSRFTLHLPALAIRKRETPQVVS